MADSSDNNEKISVVARELEEKGILKTYISYIPSFVFSRLVEFLASAIDLWILAHLLGVTALSVASRVLPFYSWFFFAFSLFDGFHMYLSHSFGENDQTKINNLFTLSFFLLLIITVISTCLYRYAPFVVYYFEGSVAGSSYLMRLGHQYLIGVSWGVFPIVALSAFSYMVRIDGSKYLPVYASCAVVIANIILNFLLIGRFRYFGAGLATSISYWIGFLILFTHFFKKNNTYQLLLKLNFQGISFKKLASLTCPRLAHHIATLSNVSILTFLGFHSFGAIFGTVSCIYNIAHEFTYIVVVGMVEAARPLIGVAYGQNDYKVLRNILHAMYKLVLPFTCALCLFLFIFPQVFPWLMNLHSYDEVFAPTCTAVRLLTVYVMIYALNFIYIKYYQQIGSEIFISIVNLLKPTIFVIPFYYLLAHTENTSGFWWANICRELITLVILLTFHLWQSYKLKHNSNIVHDA